MHLFSPQHGSRLSSERGSAVVILALIAGALTTIIGGAGGYIAQQQVRQAATALATDSAKGSSQSVVEYTVALFASGVVARDAPYNGQWVVDLPSTMTLPSNVTFTPATTSPAMPPFLTIQQCNPAQMTGAELQALYANGTMPSASTCVTQNRAIVSQVKILSYQKWETLPASMTDHLDRVTLQVVANNIGVGRQPTSGKSPTVNVVVKSRIATPVNPQCTLAATPTNVLQRNAGGTNKFVTLNLTHVFPSGPQLYSALGVSPTGSDLDAYPGSRATMKMVATPPTSDQGTTATLTQLPNSQGIEFTLPNNTAMQTYTFTGYMAGTGECRTTDAACGTGADTGAYTCPATVNVFNDPTCQIHAYVNFQSFSNRGTDISTIPGATIVGPQVVTLVVEPSSPYTSLTYANVLEMTSGANNLPWGGGNQLGVPILGTGAYGTGPNQPLAFQIVPDTVAYAQRTHVYTATVGNPATYPPSTTVLNQCTVQFDMAAPPPPNCQLTANPPQVVAPGTTTLTLIETDALHRLQSFTLTDHQGNQVVPPQSAAANPFDCIGNVQPTPTSCLPQPFTVVVQPKYPDYNYKQQVYTATLLDNYSLETGVCAVTVSPVPPSCSLTAVAPYDWLGLPIDAYNPATHTWNATINLSLSTAGSVSSSDIKDAWGNTLFTFGAQGGNATQIEHTPNATYTYYGEAWDGYVNPPDDGVCSASVYVPKPPKKPHCSISFSANPVTDGAPFWVTINVIGKATRSVIDNVAWESYHGGSAWIGGYGTGTYWFTGHVYNDENYPGESWACSNAITVLPPKQTCDEIYKTHDGSDNKAVGNIVYGLDGVCEFYILYIPASALALSCAALTSNNDDCVNFWGPPDGHVVFAMGQPTLGQYYGTGNCWPPGPLYYNYSLGPDPFGRTPSSDTYAYATDTGGNCGSSDCPCQAFDYSPLIVDVYGKGVVPTPPNEGVYFAIMNPIHKLLISWISAESADSAMTLVADWDGNGNIPNINYLFGNNTIGPDGKKASNGFEALKKYDVNHDGRIDANDPVFHDLRLWSDLNVNGVADPGELHTLEELGVTSIDLNYVARTETADFYGNASRERSDVVMADGTMRLIVDMWWARGYKKVDHPVHTGTVLPPVDTSRGAVASQ